MAKEKLSAGEKSAKRAERKAKLKALESENNTRWQAIKYFLCMCSAGVIQLASTAILEPVLGAAAPTWSDTYMTFITSTRNAAFTASTIGLALSILWNFTLNRKFTFKAANNVPLAMFLAFLFYVPFYPFQIWFVATIDKALNGSTGGFILATGLVMILNGILEFCWQRFVIYRKSTNTAVKKNKSTDEVIEDAEVVDNNEEVIAEVVENNEEVTAEVVESNEVAAENNEVAAEEIVEEVAAEVAEDGADKE